MLQQQAMNQQQQQAAVQQMHQQQRKDHPHQQFVSAEAQAKEKLSHYVYEYLLNMNATKTADMFKNEVLVHHTNGNPNIHIDVSAPPGFLLNWFSVFWDLYSAHPDKKEKAEPSNEAKIYHKMMFPGCGFPSETIVNGAIPPFGPSSFHNQNMGPMSGAPMPQQPPPQNLPEGNFPASAGFYNASRAAPQPGPSSQSNQASPIPGGPPSRYMHQQATRSGAPTPSSIPNNFPTPQINAMNEQQMRMAAMVQQHQQRQTAQQQGRLPMNLGPVGSHVNRPIRPPPQFGNQFMDLPTGTPPFSNPMMHNGGGTGNAMCTSASLMSPTAAVVAQQQASMSNAGQIMTTVSEGGPGSHEHTRMIMMSNGGVQQQQQFVNHHEQPGANTPIGNPASVSGPPIGLNNASNCEPVGNLELGPSGGGVGVPHPQSQLHSLLNGKSDMPMAMEMKQSPVSVHFGGSQQGGSAGGCGMNGGTPMAVGSVGQVNNSAAGPGSAHSQTGGSANSQQQIGCAQQQTPISETMDLGVHMGNHQSEEISKIKASLMDGFPQANQFQQ